MSTTDTAHDQKIPIASDEVEFIPPHPDRTYTETYKVTHHFLINVSDLPCEICGVKKSTLNNPSANKCGAKQMQTHHRLQRELADALDWEKVAKDYAGINSREDFDKWVDSPHNMRVLCDVHHISDIGVHHSLVDDFEVRKYLLDNYVLNDKAANAEEDIAKDNQIVESEVPQDERI